MSMSVQMMAYVCVQQGLSDLMKMILESIHKSAFCLAYILLFASLAGDAIEKKI